MSNIIIVSGAKEAGKTRLLMNLYKKFRSDGKIIRGFVSEKVLSEERVKSYNLRILPGDISFEICSNENKPGYTLKTGKFYFNPPVFKIAQAVVIKAPERSIILVDEIGLLEYSGTQFNDSYFYGFADMLLEIISKQSKFEKIIISVRKSHIDKIISKFGIDGIVYDLDIEDINVIEERILNDK